MWPKTGMTGAVCSCSVIVTVPLLGLFGTIAQAGDSPDLNCASPTSVRHDTDDKSRLWRYGACVDLGYALDFNFPQNHLWRSKGTTPRVNEFAPNLGLIYVRKDMIANSPWGMEFGLQGGYDTQGQGPPTRPEIDRPIGGADTLRHLSRANVSYLPPVGTGLTITAGLLNSFIGYDSFYAMNNHTYTRAYIADYSLYFMMGISAQYRISDRIKAAVYVVNGYTYLSKPNDLPSYGAQVVWSPSARLTVTQNLYVGPEQFKTDIEYWRVFSDSIIEYRFETVTLALAYDIGTEGISQTVGASPDILDGRHGRHALAVLTPIGRGPAPGVLLGPYRPIDRRGATHQGGDLDPGIQASLSVHEGDRPAGISLRRVHGVRRPVLQGWRNPSRRGGAHVRAALADRGCSGRSTRATDF